MKYILIAMLLMAFGIFILIPTTKDIKNDTSAMASVIRLKTFRSEIKHFFTNKGDFPNDNISVNEFSLAKYITWDNENILNYEFENTNCLKIIFNDDEMIFSPTNANKKCNALYELLERNNLLSFKGKEYHQKIVFKKKDLEREIKQ